MQKLNYLQQKKLSPADELREILNSLEERQIKVNTMDSTQALILLRDLDQAYALFNQVGATGTDLQPEHGRFQTIQARLKKSARPLLKALGGPNSLHKYRPTPAPPRQEQWWWYIHDIVTEQQQRLRRRILAVIGLILLVAGGIWLAFKTILAPSPEVIARVEAESNAYSAIDAGDYPAALAFIEAGLVKAPDDPGLLIFQGVLYEATGQEAKAAQSYDQAQARLADPLNFFVGRGQLWLRLNQPDKAEQDSRAAIEIDEDFAGAWLLLGQALEFQGKRFEAIAAYEKAGQLALDSGDNQVVVLARMALGRIGAVP